MKILRGARDHIVCTCICVIMKGAAVRLHARGARIWGSLGSCPKGVVFRHRGPVFYGVVPEKGGFQARGSGFLWSRARKGWFSGTRVRFSMESCPKGVGFRHEGPVFYGVVPEKGAVLGTGVASVRPDVPKASGQRARYAEVWKGSVQFYRTSTVIGVIWQKSTEVRKE